MPPRIRRVIIKNFKSFTQAAVDLGPFTLLVGHNGAGKSNFIDALAFVQECLSQSVRQALDVRGGGDDVFHAGDYQDLGLGIRLILELNESNWADYSFEIDIEDSSGGWVRRERCVIGKENKVLSEFEVDGGTFVQGKEIPGIRAQLAPDRLALFAASAIEEFRPLYDLLASMRTYNVIPEKLREHRKPDAAGYLKSDGSNAASVLYAIQNDTQYRDRHDLINTMLSQVVNGIGRVETRRASDLNSGNKRPMVLGGDFENIRFLFPADKYGFYFDSRAVSEGTLRMLAILLAVYQPGFHPVIAIEEPEMTIHPAAAEIMLQVLMDAAHDRQILVTTHSADILDNKEVKEDQIRLVTMEQGRTVISPLAASSRQTIREHLYSAGELLRIDELSPDLESAHRLAAETDLFGPPFAGTEHA